MTLQLAACYEGTESFPDVGGPPRTGAVTARTRSRAVLQDSEPLIPSAPRLTVNTVHYRVNSVARN
jgi:hypothetical protein